jgi:hypothetical protein
MNRPCVVASRRKHGHIEHVAGHAVLDPVQTWCSLASVLEVHDLVAVADRIITTSRSAKALASPEDLTQALSTVRYGRPSLVRAASEMRMGAWSRPESLTRVACLRAGLPEPVLNTAVPVGGGRRAAPDLAWPEFMVCAEYDGSWHDNPRQRADDLERHELLVDGGWVVTHIRAHDLFPEPLVAVARILRRLNSRGYRHPGVVRRGLEMSWLP